jgi:catechol 2,3-dioxygenase-like lactoylglutathione lyase family enzyme
MSGGEIHHIRLTVSSLSQSAAFYTSLLSELNYRVARQASRTISFHHRTSPAALILSETGESLGLTHSRDAPGLHHLAFHASSKEEVDRIYEDVLLRSKQIRILDPPCDCPEYSPGYYAVFFEDPDGIKLEIAFTPQHFHQE